ncbi:MAG TPA: indolepyruvate ferredoxin oxidoreductase [Methanoculleus sp.]|nr:indolepyruvate ferredoxin oxidoreductase [Methanoculleus sp.]
MNGEEILITALQRAADRAYAVPGYPVTRIAGGVAAAITVNEKVALEYALGDSLALRRAAVIVKNVGVNALADPLVNATTQGLRAGVVVVAGDDIEVAASQNAQDTRFYGELAEVPVIEPSAATMGAAVEAAFRASEEFSRVALLRITPAALAGEADAAFAPPSRGTGTLAAPSLTMRGRVAAAARRTRAMFAWARASSLNTIAGGTAGVGACPGDSRVVTVYPPPGDRFGDVAELGRPFFADHRRLRPPAADREPETMAGRGYYRTLCPTCPYALLFARMQEKGMTAVCDIGCSLLAMNPPYGVGIASYGLGSSVAVAATSTRVSLTGDYAMLHSGINALIDITEKGLPLLCIVLKNKKMGMTGGHPAPDVARYLRWADPVVIPAEDAEALDRHLAVPGHPRVLIIEGCCPEGEEHETVECGNL